jgi:hypothetical protein
VRFWRFLRNGAVSADEMVCHAVTGTAARVAGRDIVVVHDTSELALGGRRARANGYGPVGKGGALRGLLLHAGLALEAGTGALVGLVDAQIWNRDEGAVAPRWTGYYGKPGPQVMRRGLDDFRRIKFGTTLRPQDV